MAEAPAKPKILVIAGTTATGKSDLAVELAREFNGEVISADSRQVYVGLDIGTGKITTQEMKGVPHHLLDIADPHVRFTAQHWKVAAEKAVADILSRGKLPIICGGTGFYISSLVDDIGFPEVDADPKQQKGLEEKPPEELFAILKGLDPVRAASIDAKNKRRLSRAIIVARALGAVPPLSEDRESKYDALFIGLTLPDAELDLRIKSRLLSRINAGMIDEAKRLHAPAPEGIGLSYERMDELGLEYKYLAEFLQGKIKKNEMIETLCLRIGQYAKRQKTWFKRDKRMNWFNPNQIVEIKKRVAEFLAN